MILIVTSLQFVDHNCVTLKLVLRESNIFSCNKPFFPPQFINFIFLLFFGFLYTEHVIRTMIILTINSGGI